VLLPEAAVVTGKNLVGIVWIDPYDVMVAVCVGRGTEAAPPSTLSSSNRSTLKTLFSFLGSTIRLQNKTTPHHELAGIQFLPALASIVRAVQRALFRFDHGVNHVGLEGATATAILP